RVIRQGVLTDSRNRVDFSDGHSKTERGTPNPPARSRRAGIIMKSFRACVLVGLVAGLMWSGCGQQKLPQRKQARVIRLFDVFQPEDLSGKVSPEELGIKPVEWKV